MPDYPGAPGRTGYAVGLDVPASVIAMLHDLKKQGYAVDGIPESPRELLDLIEAGGHVLEPARTTSPLSETARRRARGGRSGMGNGLRKSRLSPSAPPPSATSPWRWPPIAGARPTAAPTITTRRCRRAMR